MIKKLLDDVLMVAGMVFICLGMFLIYIPVGFITMGCCLIALAILVAKWRR